MKNKYTLLFLLIASFTSKTMAQIVSGNAFLKGDYIEVGMRNSGSFGTSVAAPTGYHQRTGTSSGTANSLGFVADPAKNGWTVGTPNYFGDFFVPGNPEEGWAIKMNNVSYNNNTSASLTQITGGSVTYSNTGSNLSATWSGTKNGLAISATTSFPLGALYFVTTIKVKNTTASTINNVYYMRTVDADQEAPLTSNYKTVNSIVQQNPNISNTALVTSIGQTYGAYLGLGSRDCRARVTRGGTVDPLTNRDPQMVWSGTNGLKTSGTGTGDSAISISFYLGNIAPGDSTTFSFAYILGLSELNLALAATEISFYGDGATITSGSSSSTCSGSAFPINIQNGLGYSSWVWAPTTGLSPTTGSSVSATLTSPQTYTVTGAGLCGNLTMNVTLNPISLPTPGPAGSIDGTNCLSNLPMNNVTYSVTAIPDATTYNWTVPSGAGIISGAGTNVIQVNFANTFTNGLISVYGHNVCGNGTNSSLLVGPCGINTGAVVVDICKDTLFNVPYSVVGSYNAGNFFVAQLSDSMGNFTAATKLDSLNSTTNGIISAIIPNSIIGATGYRIRVISTDPVVVGADNGADITVQSPPSISCPPNQSVYALSGVCNAIVSYSSSPLASGIPLPDLSYAFTGATVSSGNGDGSGSTFNVGTTLVKIYASNSCGLDSCDFNVVVNDTISPKFLSSMTPVNIINPDFEVIYKAGSTTVTAPGFPLHGGAAGLSSQNMTGTNVTFSDATTGDHFDMAAWEFNTMSVQGLANENSNFISPRNTIAWFNGNTFGGGTNEHTMYQVLAENLQQGTLYTLTTDFGWRYDNSIASHPPLLRLYAGATLLTPISALAPPLIQGQFVTYTNTYFVNDLSISGPLKVEFGLGSNIDGQQLNADHVTLMKSTPFSFSNVTANNDLGVCGAIVSWPLPLPFDNCSIQSMNSSHSSGSYFPVGSTVVNYTLTDINSNISSATFTVTVVDTTKPTISCPGNITQDNDANLCSAVVTFTAPVGTDNCPLSTTAQTQGLASGSIFPVGTTINKFVVTDASGNKDSCTFTVTINDTTKPSIICSGPVTINNSTGLCTGSTTLVKPIVSDNCNLISLGNALHFDGVNDVVATDSFIATNLIGDLTVETWFKATSLHGKTLVTRDYTTDFDITLWSNQLNFYHGNGTSYINLTFNYFFNPNTWYHIAVVRNISTKLVSLYVNGVFQQTLGWTSPDPSTSNAPLYIGKRACCPSFEGSIDEVRIWNTQRTASEIANNINNELVGTETGLQHYFKLNDGLPNGNNTNDTITNATTGLSGTLQNFSLNCTTTSNYVAGNVNTNSASITNNAPCIFPVGNTTVIWTATDASGNTNTCTQIVTVVDTTKPTIACSGNITQANDANICGAIINYTAPTGTDNCPLPTTAQTEGLASGSIFLVGVTTNKFIVTDASGNKDSCSFTITVTDTTKPTITCPGNITQANDAGLCSAVVTYTVTSSDNCTGQTVAQTTGLASGSIFPVGTTINKFIVTDASGNKDSCAFTVTVNDTLSPIVTCPSNFVVNNNTGICGAQVGYNVNVNDACTPSDAFNTPFPATIFFNATGLMFDLTNNGTQPIAITSFDLPLNGVSSHNISVLYSTLATSYTTIVGNPAAWSLLGSANITAAGSFTLVHLPIGGLTLMPGETRGICLNGNLSPGIAYISSSISGTLPTHTDGVLTITAGVSITGSSLNLFTGTAGSITNFRRFCGNINYQKLTSITVNSGLLTGSVFPVGTTHQIYSITDLAGNSSICSFDITVHDTTKPTISCPGNITQDNDANLCSAVVTFTAPVGTDNCPLPTTAQTEGFASGSIFPIGTTTNKFIVTDASGNKDSCTFTVTITDTTKPILICSNMYLNTITGSCYAVPSAFPIAIDNCAGSINVYQTAGAQFGQYLPIGSYPVEFQAIDSSGNIASCTFTVTISDTTKPTITCPGNITQNNDANLCSAVVTYTVTSSDNCTGQTVAQATGLASGSIFPIGTTTNKFIVTDASGNKDSCTFTVTITDTTKPSIICSGPVTINNTPGLCSGTTNLIVPTVTDNCSVIGNALQFDGVNDRVPVGTGINLTGPFTIEAWVMPTFKSNFSTILGNKIGSFTNPGFVFAINNFQQSDGKLIFESQNTQISSVSSVINWGVWQHISITYDGSIVKMYLNGTSILLDNPSAINLVSPGNPAVIGDFFHFVSAGKFKGTMDELRVWNVARSQSQLSANLNYELNAQPGLIAAYHFNQGIAGGNNTSSPGPAINTAIDASGNVNTGTLSGFALNGPTSNWISGAVFGLTFSNNAPTTYPVGNTTVTWTATDSSGNSNTCAQIVTVIDNQKPTITCPGNISQDNDAGLCSAVVTYTVPVGIDNCPSATNLQTEGLASGSAFPVGVTTNKFVVTDASGNKDSCSFTVTITDTTKPTIVCANDTTVMANQAGCMFSGTLNIPIISDNCSGVQLSGPSPAGPYGLGTTTLTWTATDTSNNIQTCTQLLTVNPVVVYNTSSAVNCDSFIWTGTTYTMSGNYTKTFVSALGCDSIHTLNLTINNSKITQTYVTACDTFANLGATYSLSGVYTRSFTTSAGCDSTDYLHLTIVHTSSGQTSITACQSYTYFGNTYTASGIYATGAYNNAVNCDSTHVLFLTIKPTSAASTSVSICGSYLWTGTNYTMSGVYTKTFMNSLNCDSVHTLHLTITNGGMTASSQSACNSYTWTGTTYTMSGVYSKTFMNVQLCDSIHTLTLTINHSNNSTSTQTACNYYTWNGTTYTTSGTYYHYTTGSTGCADTATLVLIINYSNNTSTTQTACNNYTWHGTTYTSSGTYYHYTTGSTGCADTATLVLSINYSNNTITTQTACNNYTWHGTSYTNGGTYYHYTTGSTGCADTATLVLIINYSNNTSTTQTACNNHTWYGTTYSTSGTYYHYTTGSTGCADTATLVLTINASSYGSINQSICSGASIVFNGQSINTSGTYYDTLQNVNNCDSFLTLNLTVTPGILLRAKALLGGPYNSNTLLMHDSLRVLGLIPHSEPYTSAPFNYLAIGDAGGDTIGNGVLSVTGSNAIVDWVMLEIRSAMSSSNILANKRALIQRDGDIVSSIDGQSPVSFNTLYADNYFVSVKHRNHLGLMTNTAMALTGCSGSNSIDFTTSSPVYQNVMITSNTPRKNINGLYAMWPGDANSNKNVKYNGSSNDKDYIALAIGGATSLNAYNLLVYRVEDVNMDGKIRYNGLDNDRVMILSNVGVNFPNTVLSQHTPN